MTSQSNSSQGRGHDRLPNWNLKNGGMLISQPISSCLIITANFVCHACWITNHVGFLFIDFSGGHLSVSNLRCLQLRWQVVTLWVHLLLCGSEAHWTNSRTFNHQQSRRLAATIARSLSVTHVPVFTKQYTLVPATCGDALKPGR